MRRLKTDQPKRRGAPTKPRLNHRRLARKWAIFLKNNQSMTHEMAEARFRRLYGHWIEDDLGMRVGGYGSLRNATRVGKREHQKVSSERHLTRRWAITGLFGKRRLFTSPGRAGLYKAQASYMLGISDQNYSLATIVDKTAQ